MSSSSEKVLLLGVDDRSGLSVVRSLGRNNIEIHLGWCIPKSVISFSKYVKRIHDIPAYSETDHCWKHVLISIMNSERFDLIIPCSDPASIPLQQHRMDLELIGNIYLLSDRTFELAMDKIQMNQIAKRLGLNLPKEQVVVQEGQIQEIIEGDWQWPLVMKPKSSFTPQNLRQKQYVKFSSNPDHFKMVSQDFLRHGPFQVQEYFRGIGVGIEVLVDHGNVLVGLQHERIHEPKHGGGSSYRKTVPLHSAMYHNVKVLMEALEYTGVAMVEFKFNRQSGQWIFVELNGRFWGSLPLAVAAGADFPLYLYELLVKGRRDFPQKYRVGLYGRNTKKDVAWYKNNVFGQQRALAEKVQTIFQGVHETLHLISLRERNDTFVWDDTKPGLMEVRDILLEAQKTNAKYLTQGSWPRRVIKKFNQWSIRFHMRNATQILFVCKGNICRSPFAEGYARKHCPPTVQVVSCGYFPVQGRSCPTEAIEAAQSFQINLEEHRSQIVTKELLEQASIIFLFDQENQEKISRQFPDLQKKLFYLGSCSPKLSLYIKDPVGGTVEDFTRTYENIRFSIDMLYS